MVADDGVYAQNWIQLSQRVNVCNTALCACLSKIWCHTMRLFSIVKLESTIFPEFSRAYCDLIYETKRNELKIWTSPWCSLRNLHSVRDEIKSSSVFKGRTVPFSHIMQISNLKKDILWGCSCAIYKVSSIDVLSRWKIRLRDMTPSLKNIAWLKLFCSMFLIGK